MNSIDLVIFVIWLFLECADNCSILVYSTAIEPDNSKLAVICW